MISLAEFVNEVIAVAFVVSFDYSASIPTARSVKKTQVSIIYLYNEFDPMLSLHLCSLVSKLQTIGFKA